MTTNKQDKRIELLESKVTLMTDSMEKMSNSFTRIAHILGNFEVRLLRLEVDLARQISGV